MLLDSLLDVRTLNDVCIFKPSTHYHHHRQPYHSSRQLIIIVTVNLVICVVSPIKFELSPHFDPPPQ